MKLAGAIILVILGVITFPVPSRLAESGSAWVFAAICVSSFIGAWLLLRKR